MDLGVNRHFQMIFLHDKLNSAISKKLTTKNIWDHLSEMYDLQALVGELIKERFLKSLLLYKL